MAGIFNSAIFNNSVFNTGVTDAATNIRNFSLRNWREWRREDEEIETGSLPEELQAEAQAAVAQVARAPQSDSGATLLAAMEARERYENAYREAYQGAYVAEVVAELWKADMRKLRRRRAAAILLLH